MPKLTEKPIQEISIVDINNNFKNIVDYSAIVIQKMSIQISSAFNYAVINGIVKNNPFAIKGAIIKPKKMVY